MASRATLTNKINTDLATGISITAAKHRGVEQAIVNSSIPYNRGFLAIGNLPIPTSGTITASGDITAIGTTSGVLCTMANAMPSTNYLVKIYIQGFVGNLNADSRVASPIFAILSTTQFYFYILETSGTSQNIRVWFEVISLD